MTRALECYYEAVRSGQGYCYYLPALLKHIQEHDKDV